MKAALAERGRELEEARRLGFQADAKTGGSLPAIVVPHAASGEVCIHGSRHCGEIYCKSERVRRWGTRAFGPPDAPGEG